MMNQMTRLNCENKEEFCGGGHLGPRIRLTLEISGARFLRARAARRLAVLA